MSNLDWSNYPNFTENEFRCKGKDCCGGRADMDPTFMYDLQKVRTYVGFTLPVTSGFRCPAYDTEIGGKGVHPTGKAADIAIAGENVYHLLSFAVQQMRGIGLKQHGPHSKRFMHLDTTYGPLRPRIWTYS